MNNNEQIDRPPIITEDTSEAAAAASAGAAALANASGGDRERFPSPIVSIAAGVMNESTTTTTSTKTTPTPYSNDQMHTMMSHAAETQSKLKQIQQETKLSSTSSSSLSSTCKLDEYTKSHDPPSPFIFVATNNNSTTSSSSTSSAAAASSAPAAAVHNFKLSPPLATHTSGGATAKGKTQDDQNVGKRQKKKKTKYDSWEDSEINDLDDASLKKLLEEAYWYRNPGDRKNKSERFLQMLKKAEYDEENSYRAIKTCLTRNTNSSSTAAAAAAAAVAVASSSFVSSAATSVGSSNSAAGSFGYHTNHRSSGSHRHKQGGSLQDLVEATHRSELATTSSQVAVAAAVAAAAVANHCFNCDYQLSGGRNSMNRRQHQQQHNQNSSSINSQLPNSLSTASCSSASKRINKNSTVSARQREGGSLPSSVNQFESTAIMDPAKLKHILGGSSSGGVGGEVTPTTSTSAGTGSCLSLPETEAATQFDMDDEAIMDSGSTTSTQQDSFMNRWDISADTKLWNIANGPDLETLQELREIRKTKKVNPASAAGSSFNTHSMTLLGAKILEGLQQQKQQQEQQQKQQQQQQQQQQNQQMHSFNESSKDASTVKEFLIDDALQFSVLELSAKNQQMQQQQQQQQQQYPAVPANVSGGAAACVPYPQTTDDQKHRLDTGYVSFNDNYTACSSVYGVGTTEGDSNKTVSTGGASSSITSNTTTTVNGGGGEGSGTAPKGAVEDIRASKIGRMISGGAAAPAKSGSRQFDENGNALSDGYGGGAGSGTGNGVAASTNGKSNQFTALITTTVGGGAAGGTAAAANSGSLAGSATASAVAAAHPPSSSSTQRQNSVSTLLSTGTNTTTTAMAAAAVAASINSQLGGAVPTQTSSTANINATNTTITTTKLKSKKKSQQERNTIQYLVDTQTIAGCRGADPVEQLLKYIENDEKNNSAGQKKKERKKQSKLKKSNSLVELRSCSKMEVDDLNKYQAATTDMMRQKKTGSGTTASATSATGASKHNSSSVADINRNCNKEQQGVQPQPQQQQTVASATVQVRAQPRKSERRSWGTEELQYLGDQQQKEQKTQMDWPSPAPKISTLEFPALAGMSEMDALNTVLSETAEFHVVTKKKKPKKQRAVTMDDATVGAAHHTGGNLQRMQPITKSASSNMMSHRVQQQQHYANHYGNQQLPPPPPPHSKMERQFVEKHQSTSIGSSHTSAGSVHAHGQGSQSTTSNSSGHQDSSRRKSTSSMPPSEKSDSSDLDSVHSLPIQTGKKKTSRANAVSSTSSSSTSAQVAGQRQSKQNNNNYNSPPAAISYADIARKRLEAALNSGGGTTSNTESSPTDLFNSGGGGGGTGGGSAKSSSTKQAKTRPDFPELPGAAAGAVANTLNLTTGLPMPAGTGMGTTGGAAAAATHLPPSSTSVTSSASISYSQSLNATPASSSSDVEMASPELLPTAAAAAIGSISFSSASASALSSSSYSSPPALQKSKSVENEVSYTFNSTNLDQQYPALEMTVKRHSTTNVAMASSSINNNTTITNNSNNNNNNSFSSSASSSSSYNFAAAAKQQVADKSTSAKLKAKPKEKTFSINNSSSKPSQEDASPSVTLSSASSSSPSASTSSSSPTSSSCSPIAATMKTTAATQTDRTKKTSGKFGGAALAGTGAGGTASSGASGCLAGSSSLTASGSSSAAGRPAVIILNDRDDRDATHNEFIFGDFNEDELKMFNDHENTEESLHSNQENNRNKLIRGGEDQTEVVAADEDVDETESKEHSPKLGKESSTDLSSDQLVLNDSGAASDMVNMSSTLDMLSISGEAVQSSPNAANAAAITNNNSSTLSSNTSNSSSSASISSSASAGVAGGGRTIAGGASGGGGGVSSLANQSNDSGIIANTSVNNFISKASSSDVLVSMQQLETCNDIEAAIIAAARAAAAADAVKRSTSCSRSNSQEPGEFLLPAKTVNKSSATANKTTLPVYMAYQDGDDDDETLHELSFMPDLNKMELGAASATSLPDEEHLPPPPVALARQSGVMTNTDLIVDYIASTWNAIVKSKYVTFYSEDPEPEP